MKQPKISVIVPIYGVERYLRECLDSILAQTLKDIEIILIDDGSKDACPQIIDEYALKDSRIKVTHKENGGYGQACNVGLSQATGEYIAIVEPDDYIDSDMYADLYNLGKKHGSDIVKSAYWEHFDATDCKDEIDIYVHWATIISPYKKIFKITEYPQFLWHHPSIWSCVYKKSFIEKNKIRFIEAKGGGWVDNPFQVKTMALAESIFWTPKAYYHYRPESIGNSSNLKDYRIPVDRMNDVHDFLDCYPDIYDKIFYYFTLKEVDYLYNAYKVGFSNLSNIEEIKEMKNYLIQTLNRIPESLLRKYNIGNKNLKRIKKMKGLGYIYKYWRLKLRKRG